MAKRHHHARLPAGGNRRLSTRLRHGEGFFDKNMLARARSRNHLISMHLVWGGNHHRLHPRFRQNSVQIRQDLHPLPRGPFGGAFRAPGAAGNEAYACIIPVLHTINQGLAPAPHAHNGRFNHSHASFRFNVLRDRSPHRLPAPAPWREGA